MGPFCKYCSDGISDCRTYVDAGGYPLPIILPEIFDILLLFIYTTDVDLPTIDNAGYL